MAEIVEIPIVKIKVGEYEQRIDEDNSGISALEASIRRVGVIVPVVVYPLGDVYILVAGHRRYKAALRANLDTIPANIVEQSGPRNTEVCFAENFFRKDLSPVELAGALKDCLVNEVMTVKELAAGFHRSEHWVHSTVAIYDWPKEILEAIHNERLSVSAASNLACVTDDSYRTFLVRNAVEQGATARTTAAWLQGWRVFQPQEEAITAEPVTGQTPIVPAVPQAPCICCSRTLPVNAMSHVPACGECIPIIRQVGARLGEPSAE